MPRKGYVCSDETRAKLRESHLGNPGFWTGKKRGPHTPEWRAKISAALKGRKKPDGFGEHLRAIWIGKPRSADTRAKMLRAIRTPEAREKMRVAALGKPCTHPKRQQYGEILMRSTFEVRVARAFDQLGMRWQYEPHRFHLGTQTYLPDFYLPDEQMYVEVKGWFGPDSQTTVSRFFDQHPQLPLAILMEPQIEALEAIARTAITRRREGDTHGSAGVESLNGRDHLAVMQGCKPWVIDLDPAMGTRRKQAALPLGSVRD